jgi:hypothetical protein
MKNPKVINTNNEDISHKNFTVNANFLQRHYKSGYNKALEEVDKLLNKFQNNIWLDDRTFEGIKCKTCIPLDYMDEYFEDLKQQLTKLKEKKEQ